MEQYFSALRYQWELLGSLDNSHREDFDSEESSLDRYHFGKSVLQMQMVLWNSGPFAKSLYNW